MSQRIKYAQTSRKSLSGSGSGISDYRPDFGDEQKEEDYDKPLHMIPQHTTNIEEKMQHALIQNGHSDQKEDDSEEEEKDDEKATELSQSSKTQQNRRRTTEKQFEPKPAWLSVETTLEDVNVKQQSFTIEGWMALFWVDPLDGKPGSILHDAKIQSNLEKLQNAHFKMMLQEKLCHIEEKGIDYGVEEMLKAGYSDQEFQVFDKHPVCRIMPHQQQYEYTKLDSHESPKGNQDNDPIIEINGRIVSDDDKDDSFESIRCYGERRDRFLKFTKNGIQKLKEDGYRFPFYWSTTDRQFRIFRNEIDYTTIGETGIELEYNYDHKVFKLHIHFRATLYECFENNYNDFPFEWQFLNAQLLLNIFRYSFRAKVPNFVVRSFMFDHYWSGSRSVWKHAILARKRENIDEWKLLSPWIDLRDDDNRWDDYFHQYHFSLIKLRVVRNPNYYLSYIFVPLFLMVCCAFAVFFIDPDADRLAYIVTLLLTVAAFQITVSTDLPYESQFTLIDKYFLLAYYVLALLVLESGIAKAVVDKYDFDHEPLILDGIFGGICGCMWCLYSLKYLGKWIYFERLDKGTSDICRKFRNSAFFCCVCKAWCYDHYKNRKQPRKKRHFQYWLEMDRKESSQWDAIEVIENKSQKAEIVYGTDGDIMIRDVVDGQEVERYYVQGFDDGTDVLIFSVNNGGQAEEIEDTRVKVLWTVDEDGQKDKKVMDLTDVHGNIMQDMDETEDAMLKWKHQYVKKHVPC